MHILKLSVTSYYQQVTAAAQGIVQASHLRLQTVTDQGSSLKLNIHMSDVYVSTGVSLI